MKNFLNDLPPHIKKINAHLFVGGMAHPVRKPSQRGQGQDQRVEQSPQSMGYCVHIISFRRRLVDGHDNLRTGAKPLVDAIASHLGFRNDNDPRLCWEYTQTLTAGAEGTLVRISEFEP